MSCIIFAGICSVGVVRGAAVAVPTLAGPRLLARDCCDAAIVPPRAKRIILRASGYTLLL